MLSSRDAWTGRREKNADHGEVFKGEVASLIEAIWCVRVLDDAHVLDPDAKFAIFIISRL